MTSLWLEDRRCRELCFTLNLEKGRLHVADAAKMYPAPAGKDAKHSSTLDTVDNVGDLCGDQCTLPAPNG